MKILSITNHKGGVGKTTTVSCLGVALARKGHRVLMIDLDAQANLTASYIEPQDISIYNSLKGKSPLPVLQIERNLDLVPSSEELALIELEIASRMDREYLLSDLIEPLRNNYDYILIDCPPSLGLLTINALVASTGTIITLTAETLPTKGLGMMEEIIQGVQKRANKTLQIEGILLTRYESTKLNKLIESQLRERYGDLVYNTRIRKNTDLAEAPLSKTCIYDYNSKANGAKDYTALTEELTQNG